MTDQQQGNGMRGWLKLVFALSLALNVAGLAALGTMWMRSGPYGGGEARLERMGGPLSRAMTKEQRREIGQEMRALLQTGEARAAGRAILEGLIADLRAERFDREAVAGHMAQHRARVTGRMALGQGVLLERMERMSPEERSALADRLEAQLRKPPEP